MAIVGSANQFKLELEIDEFDIVKIKKGQLVLVSLDSYKGEAYEAVVQKINPIYIHALGREPVGNEFDSINKLLLTNRWQDTIKNNKC